MAQVTLKDMLTRILEDLDLQDEDLVSQREATRLINAGIAEAEASILRLYEDYYLANADMPLVAGQKIYDLPADCYARKIRSIMYDDGNGRIYEVKRVKNWHKFLKKNVLEWTPTQTQDYRYFVTNNASEGEKIYLIPAAWTTVSGYVTIWYLRHSLQLVNLTDTCDIPEFFEFVVQFAKAHLSKKEMHPNAQMEWSLLERQRKIMEDTLATMIPDDDNEIEQDLSHYAEHV